MLQYSKRLSKRDIFQKMNYSALKDTWKFKSKCQSGSCGRYLYFLQKGPVTFHAVSNLIAWPSVLKRCVIQLFRLLLRDTFLSALNLIWLNKGLLIIKLNSYFPSSNSLFLLFLEWPSWYSSQVPHHVFIFCCCYVFCQSVFSLWVPLLARQ